MHAEAAGLVQLHVVAAALERLRVVVAFSAELHVAAAVWVQLCVAAAFSALFHVVAALLVRPRAWARFLEQLRGVTALSAEPRAWAELLEYSPFAALWYAVLSFSVCFLCVPCSHALPISLRRLCSYVRSSLQCLCAWHCVLA